MLLEPQMYGQIALGHRHVPGVDFVQGALEELLSACDHVAEGVTICALDDIRRAAITARCNQMNEEVNLLLCETIMVYKKRIV